MCAYKEIKGLRSYLQRRREAQRGAWETGFAGIVRALALVPRLGALEELVLAAIETLFGRVSPRLESKEYAAELESVVDWPSGCLRGRRRFAQVEIDMESCRGNSTLNTCES